MLTGISLLPSSTNRVLDLQAYGCNGVSIQEGQVMERYKLKTLLLSDEDLRVLMESLWHSFQRADIPPEDHDRIKDLRERFGEKFNADV